MREFYFAFLIFISFNSLAQLDTIYFDHLKAVGNYVGGKEEGTWTYYYLNNQQQSHGNYKAGILEGAWINWHPSGQKYTEGQYLHGDREGKWQTWDSLGRIVRVENFVQNVRNGLVKEWNYEKDEVVTTFFKSGVIHGKTEYRTISTNQIKLTLEYKDGKKDGVLVWYHPNGRVKSKGMFVNDLEEGQHIWYNEDGTVNAIANYNNGNVVK